MADEGMEKYGVEDQKSLLEEELRQVRDRLSTKLASEQEQQYLIQRESDLIEAISHLK